MILSATEIDLKFNVNSLTGSNGVLMGALGGAPDTACGAKLTLVVAPSMRKRYPIVVEEVMTVCTPGQYIDLLVTERGICVNPSRPDIEKNLNDAGIETMPIEKLWHDITKLTGIPNPPKRGNRVVGIVRSRDGAVLDQVYDLLDES